MDRETFAHEIISHLAPDPHLSVSTERGFGGVDFVDRVEKREATFLNAIASFSWIEDGPIDGYLDQILVFEEKECLCVFVAAMFSRKAEKKGVLEFCPLAPGQMSIEIEAIEEIESEIRADLFGVNARKTVPRVIDDPTDERVFVLDQQSVESCPQTDTLARSWKLERLEAFFEERLPFGNPKNPVESLAVGGDDPAGDDLFKTLSGNGLGLGS